MTITEKLAAIQAALKAPKSQFNKFGNYHYRKAEDILEAVKPHLTAQKCALTCTDEILLIGDRFYIKATATLWDAESNQTMESTAYAREEDEKKGMDGSQVTGASSSYARKYALNGLLCIDDTADSDTTNVGDGKPAEKAVDKKKAASKGNPQPQEESPANPKETGNTAESEHDKWVRSIAMHAVNKKGVKAEDAYRAKYNPTEEQWQMLMEEVFRYQLANGISD